ncbi:Dictyostelium Caatp-actin in complex with gelsolin segment 1 [Obelidium mucronatum]|nr:Dictyostelium Caatp-actin in complex with gelsolin segment 1 [Obelidium mucronatum]
MDRTVVIHTGSQTCTTGFAGDASPQSSFPAIVAHWPERLGPPREGVETTVLGHRALDLRYTYDSRFAVHGGRVTDWERLTSIWEHVYFEELRIVSDDHPVLLIEGPLNPKSDREKLSTLMFEGFNVPASYLANEAVLSLYSTGSVSGLVLDIGESASHVVPVYEGHSIPFATQKSNHCGENISRYFYRHLSSQENPRLSVKGLFRVGILDEWKQQCCYVALDYDAALQKTASSSNVKYRLPDHQELNNEEILYQTPEFLFQPLRFERHITEKMLYGNILLEGGTTRFRGFSQRLHKELSATAPRDTNINITYPSSKKYSSWIGGSILASLSTFESMCITKEEYDEYGPGIVHYKCY